MLTKSSVGYLLAKIQRYEEAFRQIIATDGYAHDGEWAREIAKDALEDDPLDDARKQQPDTEMPKSYRSEWKRQNARSPKP
jgi:hypothetical protein